MDFTLYGYQECHLGWYILHKTWFESSEFCFVWKSLPVFRDLEALSTYSLHVISNSTTLETQRYLWGPKHFKLILNPLLKRMAQYQRSLKRFAACLIFWCPTPGNERRGLSLPVFLHTDCMLFPSALSKVLVTSSVLDCCLLSKLLATACLLNTLILILEQLSLPAGGGEDIGFSGYFCN